MRKFGAATVSRGYTGVRLAIAVSLLAGALSISPALGGATASAKVISGELQCAPGDKVASIWMLGSRSGWHGFDYPDGQEPYLGQYSIPNAVPGETIQAWIGCAVLGESYSSFKVGRGATRHICSSGWMCLPVGLGECGVLVAFTGLNLRVLACLAENAW